MMLKVLAIISLIIFKKMVLFIVIENVKIKLCRPFSIIIF